MTGMVNTGVMIANIPVQFIPLSCQLRNMRRKSGKKKAKTKLTHSPPPTVCMLLGCSQDRLCNVSTDPDVDDSRDGGEDTPEQSVTK